MSHEIDISFLDKREFLQRIFPMALNYNFDNIPQSDPNADVYFVDINGGDVRLCCKYYTDDKDSPSILYFHGNDESSLNQSAFGSHIIEIGINIFVTDYRGYGISDGSPTMTTLFHDSHQIWEYFKNNIIRKEKYNPAVFLMGRSLGSLPAVELAYHYPDDFKGLILESGSAMNFKSAWAGADSEQIKKLSGAKFYNKDKIKDVVMPTLFIHGEKDELMPLQIGQAMYDLSGAKRKNLVIIPEAGHNNLRDIGYEKYYTAIEDFVKKNARTVKTRTVIRKPAVKKKTTGAASNIKSNTASTRKNPRS